MNRFHPHPWRVGGQAFLALLVLAAVGCDLPGRPKAADRPVAPDQVLGFAALYGQNCAGCHGADGKFGPAPPLNDPLFRAIVPVETLEKVVAGGRHGTLMPAFAHEQGGPLTPVQVAVLVNEIKGIPYKLLVEKMGETASVEVVSDPQGQAPLWGLVGKPPDDAPAYLAHKAFLDDSAANQERGFAAYTRACAACHGDHGQGVVRDDRLVRTISDPAFLTLVSDQALRRIAITGRPDLGMPDYAERGKEYPNYKPLTDQEVTDLVALLSYWSQSGTIGADGKPQVKQKGAAAPKP